MCYLRKFAFLIFFIFSPPATASDTDDLYSFCIENGSMPEHGGIDYSKLEPDKIINKCLPLEKNYDDERYNHITFILGRSYMKKNDFKKALYMYEKSQFPDSFNNIGYMYFNGHGVEKNLKLANKYYVKGRKRGSNVAKLNEARNYFYGNGVEKNIEQAFILFKELSNIETYKGTSYSFLADYFEIKKDFENAVKFYEKAYLEENYYALKKLAKIYSGNYFEFKNEFKNHSKSIRYWRKLFLRNEDIDAALAIADSIKKGITKSESSDEWSNLLASASNNGSTRAALKLATYYLGEKESKPKNAAKGLLYSEAAYKNYHANESNEETWPVYLSSIFFYIRKGEKYLGKKINNSELRKELNNFYHKKFDENTRRFTFKVKCGKTENVDFDFYISNWGYDYPNINDQFKWVEEVRGCSASKTSKSSMNGLFKISLENDMDYPELVAYSLKESDKIRKKKKEQVLAELKKSKKVTNKTGLKIIEGNIYYVDEGGLFSNKMKIKVDSVSNRMAVVEYLHGKGFKGKLAKKHIDQIYNEKQFDELASSKNMTTIGVGVGAALLGALLLSDDEGDLTINQLFEKRCKAESRSGFNPFVRARNCFVQSELGWFGGEKRCVCQDEDGNIWDQAVSP